jgi:hypothetical protein
MGATNFSDVGTGSNVQDAFYALVREAQWEHGHGGYTGTIAEKHDYVLFAVPEGLTPMEAAAAAMSARNIMDYDDEKADWVRRPMTPESVAKHAIYGNYPEKQADLAARIAPHMATLVKIGEVASDKWGPAAAFQLADDKWLFFGLASD